MSVIKLNISDVSQSFSASDNMFGDVQSGGDLADMAPILLILLIIACIILSGISAYYGYKKYSAPAPESFSVDPNYEDDQQ